MKLESCRKHRRRSRWVEGIFQKNPILVCGLALPFAMMVTNNLKNSVSISILMACSLIPTVLLAPLIGGKLPRWLSWAVYALFSMALVIAFQPLTAAIAPEVGDSLGIYVPILSLNTLMFTLCGRYSQPGHRPVLALVDAVGYSAGFALAMCLLAAIRGLLGNNTLWGRAVKLPVRLTGVQIPFAGFILVALLAALLQFLRRVAVGQLYRRDNPPSGGAA